ncbi:MAG: hypothetical protein J6C54_02165 [Lachnospiraceae bacterium]|nr:hypothetical protein [Lachnospiraceae bacterium]
MIYGLDTYTELQIRDWQASERIVLYIDELQFTNFVDGVIANGNNSKKIYFGKIPVSYAKVIENKTGINVQGFNLTIRASEIIKILKSHGTELGEQLRGQVPVTKEKLLLIPKIVMEADTIILSDRKYENKDVLIFSKIIDDLEYVVTYVSNKHKDLSVQTMYTRKIKKEKHVTTPSGESLLAYVQNA